MVVFEAQHSTIPDFVLNGAVVERVDSYKYLGFVFLATKGLTSGTTFLVAAARKAMFASGGDVHSWAFYAVQAI